MACPNTFSVAVKFTFPSALYKASLLANILIILSSQKAIKSVFLVCNFWILPYSGFNSLVILYPVLNSFNLFILFWSLNIPEYIKLDFWCLFVYSSFDNVVETLIPGSKICSLKSSSILLDSIPFPSKKALVKFKVWLSSYNFF